MSLLRFFRRKASAPSMIDVRGLRIATPRRVRPAPSVNLDVPTFQRQGKSVQAARRIIE
ncbi:hypothetical protein [Verrucomicrobium sp. GAS474]|uniref:hypothetical protein n=1 Tax=Verrucomicrobium sp. GAS474 TaxID=1882831 RepID=UPI0012FFA7F9|nr:hypothetical protein [Verrucomicrobium sp. GAS474]